MIEEKRINVGIILSTTLREWQEIQAQIGKKADIVFVKKVACPHKLRISEEFVKEEENIGENGECRRVAADS